MFHIVNLNGLDSGNAVTLLYLPNFQSEVWPAVTAVVWTGADWMAGAAEAVRLGHVGSRPALLGSRCVHVADSTLFCFSAGIETSSALIAHNLVLFNFLKVAAI